MDQKKIIVNSDNEDKLQSSANNNITAVETPKEINAYAGELPKWDLLPPAVVIRRVKRSI